MPLSEKRVQRLVRAHVTTGNELLMYIMDLYDIGLHQAAATCAIELANKAMDPKLREHLANVVGQSALKLNNKMMMQYALQNGSPSTRALISLALNDELNKHMRITLMKTATTPSCEKANTSSELPLIVSAHRRLHVLINAGGPKLTRQLWSNLHSLYRSVNDDQNAIDVTVVHASEWTMQQMGRFRDTFSRLQFYNVCNHPAYVDWPETKLRGFQIKLACVSAIPDILHKHAAGKQQTTDVIMTDADILWITTPFNIITEMQASSNKKNDAADIAVFRDIWYESKQHSQSCSTRYLLNLHGCDVTNYECESGVVAIRSGKDDDTIAKISAACVHLTRHYEYYFAFCFGDKDMYMLAAAAAGKVFKHLGKLPAMLGHLRATSGEPSGKRGNQTQEVIFDAMLHSLPSGVFTHIHTTLFPIESAEWTNRPTHFTEDIDDIEFVTQDGKQTIGIDAHHMRMLAPEILQIIENAKSDNERYPLSLS